MTSEEVYRASTVPGGDVMDMMMSVREFWCGPAMHGLMHASIEKDDGPIGRGSYA
jgi:hypothetical protein